MDLLQLRCQGFFPATNLWVDWNCICGTMQPSGKRAKINIFKYLPIEEMLLQITVIACTILKNYSSSLSGRYIYLVTSYTVHIHVCTCKMYSNTECSIYSRVWVNFHVFSKEAEINVNLFLQVATFLFKVWFQKISIPPPWSEFQLRTPHLSGISIFVQENHQLKFMQIPNKSEVFTVSFLWRVPHKCNHLLKV